jgi:glyoxylase-like metal-dependent hydrolase (beta-lactamase superfamily II)
MSVVLPPSMQVIERGWLSSNQIVFDQGNGVDGAAVIDSGYVGQATQTVELVRSALAGRQFAQLFNTHSHSDHVGGNAALQAAFGCRITIPAGIEPSISAWDETALLLSPAGQRGARFRHDATLSAGDRLELGGMEWVALAAPGHDMHALMFHCPQQRLLISGDALWHDGFGVVFNELLAAEFDAATGADVGGFSSARATLDTIASLAVDIVIPGHGAAFSDVDAALGRAYSRLAVYEQDKRKLARNAVKACFTFNLLDLGSLEAARLAEYVAGVPFFAAINRNHFGFSDSDFAEWLLEDLQRSGAVETRGGVILPLMAA